MKPLKDWINLKTDIKLSSLRHKYIGSYDSKDVKLDKNLFESSFENFIKLNSINNIDENIYDYYIRENFNEDYRRYYGLYQKHLYESILNSYSASDLMKKIWNLSSNVHIFNIGYANNHKITTFWFSVNTKDDIDNIFTNKVISLLRLYNYYMRSKLYDEENNKYDIIIEPYKPKDITNKIYNDLNGILYHVTSKEIYENNIRNKELKPKYKNKLYEYRDGRIFFIGNNDFKRIKEQLFDIASTAKIKDPIILKIDLNKYKNKLRFRIDCSANGYNAYFTEEPIPDFCITSLNF